MRSLLSQPISAYITHICEDLIKTQISQYHHQWRNDNEVMMMESVTSIYYYANPGVIILICKSLGTSKKNAEKYMKMWMQMKINNDEKMRA